MVHVGPLHKNSRLLSVYIIEHQVSIVIYSMRQFKNILFMVDAQNMQMTF